MSNIIEMELSTECVCQVENEDGEFVESPECFNCWDDELEMFVQDIYKPWIAANRMNEATCLTVHYGDMNWDRRAGGFSCQVKDLEELEPLKLNGDFRLRIKLEGKSLTVVRSSHDELGAKFSFEVLQNYCETCELELSYAVGMKPDWSRSKCGVCVEAEELTNA